MTDIAKEIAELAEMKTHELRERWRRIHRAEPPPKISRDLLIRASAYQIQESEFGGLSRATKRRLHSLAQKMGGEARASFNFACSWRITNSANSK